MTLQELKTEVINWRNSKPNPQSKMPRELKSKIFSATDYYSNSKIIKELQLSPSFFSDKRFKKSNNEAESQKLTFVRPEFISNIKDSTPSAKFIIGKVIVEIFS
jgi:hypothetical protein